MQLPDFTSVTLIIILSRDEGHGFASTKLSSFILIPAAVVTEFSFINFLPLGRSDNTALDSVLLKTTRAQLVKRFNRPNLLLDTRK